MTKQDALAEAARVVTTQWFERIDPDLLAQPINDLYDALVEYDAEYEAAQRDDPYKDASPINADSDEEIALQFATWLRQYAHDPTFRTPTKDGVELALSRAVWLEEIADRARAYLAQTSPPPALTDDQCNEFRRLPVSFNDMVRAIWTAGFQAKTPRSDP